MSSPAVSLVMPAYNSARYIDANVGRVLDFFDRAGIDGEVVVADDGSTDGTADAIRHDDRVRVLRLEHGGKGAAVRAGMAAATGDIRAFTDGDLPYGMEPLPLAIAYIQERRYHTVIGDRTLPGSAYESTGILRTIVSELASFAFRTLVTGGIYDTQCGFKVFRGDVAAEVFRLTAIKGFAIDVELIYLLLKYRLDLKRIPVQLERNAPSSVRVVHDSLQAFADIATIRINWARGRYRSPALIALLQTELHDDVEGAATRLAAGQAAIDPGRPTRPVIALAYLAIAVFLGDALASRWFRPVTWFHRLAAAFLVGLLIATWVTYLMSLLFDGRTEDALLVGNLASGWAMALAAIAIYRWVPARPDAGRPRRRIRGWDVITLVAIGLLVTWMMTSTYSYSNGELGIATGLWSDFGPTTAIAQNFALGDNFPTEYPHFAGEAIRYHFLFYFQVGNLTYLGLDPATANNVLSIGSMMAMLVLVTALGERLFRNAAVGRIGAALFFFHGALSFIPYLAGLGSVERAINEVPNLNAFLTSGFPYRGEEWGIWTQIVFLNQRHLASAIGILLVIVIFLLDRIDRDERAPAAEPERAPAASAEIAPAATTELAQDAGPAPASDTELALTADAEPEADVPPAEPPPGPGRLERSSTCRNGPTRGVGLHDPPPGGRRPRDPHGPVAGRLRAVRRPRRLAAAVERRHVHRRRRAPGGVVGLLPAPSVDAGPRGGGKCRGDPAAPVGPTGHDGGRPDLPVVLLGLHRRRPQHRQRGALPGVHVRPEAPAGGLRLRPRDVAGASRAASPSSPSPPWRSSSSSAWRCSPTTSSSTPGSSWRTCSSPTGSSGCGRRGRPWPCRRGSSRSASS